MQCIRKLKAQREAISNITERTPFKMSSSFGLKPSPISDKKKGAQGFDYDYSSVGPALSPASKLQIIMPIKNATQLIPQGM